MDLHNRTKSDKALITDVKTETSKEDCTSDARSHIDTDNDDDDNTRLSIVYWLFMLIVGVVLFHLAIRLHESCHHQSDFLSSSSACPSLSPSQPPSDHHSNSGALDCCPVFNDSLARKHLVSISKLGNRPAGSTANEIHAPSYLIGYLEALKARYIDRQERANIQMHISEQVAQLNAFPLHVFGYHVSSIYDRIKNVVVRLHDTDNDNTDHKISGRQSSATPAILINCHYDSFFGGIGASDDLASCAVMLETIHAILRHQPVNLKLDLIFLFNGAEENMLQGSHAFVSQHRFASDVKLAVNLEAAGSGGRQMIFQTSYYNPWLIGELAGVLQQPMASVIGQEIFSANLIPSDTDFRIFRDFGRIPGLDFAFVTNGYVYHTKYDTEDRIAQACLRHTGNNVLRLALKLANSNSIAILPEDEKYVSETIGYHSPQRIVYFDFLGFVLISYSELFGGVFNLGLCVVVVGLIAWRAVGETRGPGYFRGVTKALVNQVIWAVTNVCWGLILGWMVDKFGCKMSWYAIRYNLVGLFLVPLLWWFFIYHQYAYRLLFNFPKDSNLLFVYHRDSSLIVLSFLVCLLMAFRLMSSYLITIWLLFVIVDVLVTEVLERMDLAQLNLNFIHFFRDTFCLTIPFLYSFYLLYILYDVFIPIFGRAGPTYPDIIMSGLTAVSLIIPGIVLSGSVYLTSKNSKKWLTFIFLHLSISYYIFLHCTHYGFPYNQSEMMPRKQRIFINHVTRNIRNELGQTQVSESGIWMISLDANKLGPLKSQLQDVIRDPMQEVFCELRPYCGYPLLFPYAKVIDNSLWLSQKPHQLKPSASIIILGKVTHISGMVNVTMQVCGPTHTHIYLMTPSTMRITSWSLGPDPPKPIKMPSFSDPNYHHYFIYYSYGKKPEKPLKIWMMFLPKIDLLNTVHKDPSNNQIEIALAAHYLTERTSELETMSHIMPNWVVSTSLASTYEHIVVDFDQNLSYVQ